MNIGIDNIDRKLTQEQKDFKELIVISCMNDIDLYNSQAIRFARKYIPRKAIDHYLPPNMVFDREVYQIILDRMIHNYHVMKSLRFEIQYAKDRGREPDPTDLEQLKVGENLGF